MTSSLTCLEDAEILRLASGDAVSPEVAAHVDACSQCLKKLERAQADLAILRAINEEPPVSLLMPASTVGESTCDPGNTNGRVDRSATRTSPDGSETDSAPGDGPLPSAIGKYLVVGRFPPSGQAEVYRVVHPQFQQERVLKLAKESVGPDGHSVLVEEGKLMAELEHPHLIRVYDLDFLGDRPYLVMEYIRGRNLGQYAGERPLSPRQAATLVAKVAGAAAFAHRRGIVHRDIKPKNILVDERGEPRLIDFGMARLRTAWSDDREEPDGGTFAFMAPEQARIDSPADREKVGPRSDVFALGATLYFLLTDKAPFPGRNWREAGDRARRCDYDARPLKDRKIPSRLRRICLKAMAADPAERFGSAEELARSLESFLRRPKLIAVSALALLIPVAALGAWSLWPAPPARAIQPQPAPAPLEGELIVKVWSRGDGGKQGLKVDEPGALPLLAGELVHLEARLNQPAYPYLLWLDGQGHVSVLYPRQDGKFGSKPSDCEERDTVHCPSARDDGLRMKGPGGLETALLLVRRVPLPAETDLAALIGPLPPFPLRNELEVAVRGGDEGQPVETLSMALHRGIDEETEKIDDALLQLMERLRTNLRFDVVKAVRFAYRGE